MMLAPTMMHEAPVLVFGIVLTSLVSEDGATFAAAALAASGTLDVRFAFLGAFAGLWLGDFGVYFAARLATSAVRKEGRLSHWFAKHRSTVVVSKDRQTLTLAISRFFPGTRLPAYINAGVRRMGVITFASITAISAVLWILLIFAFFRIAPARAELAKGKFAMFGACVLAIAVLFYAWKMWSAAPREKLEILLERIRRWEFWPAWLFYAPVAFFCAWLSVRYRGISLPTIANLNQKNGGIIGESKIEILRELAEVAHEAIAEAHVIPEGSFEVRLAVAAEIQRRTGFGFPLVLKPDTAQRGAGFRKIEAQQQLEEYLRAVKTPIVMQRYVLGPREAGIFYYRFPNEASGHILGITRKRFPHVVGASISTIRELIESDSRARIIAKTYVARFGASARRIPAAGEKIRLVEAGNHCQGCIFEDGQDLYSRELLAAMDVICKKLPGFYIGRFDIRYGSDEELRQGKNFTIIELNGAASEATDIYDAKNSLFRAYAKLYRQWQLVYAIVSANRAAGIKPASAWSVWRDWQAVAGEASEYPIAD